MNAAYWLSTQAPALPQTWAMRLDVSLGWALVLALLAAVLAARLSLTVRRLLAWGLALWTLVPGTFSLDYWLGLAFHAPSLSAQLLCLVFLQRLLYPTRVSIWSQPWGVERRAAARWLGLGALPLLLAVLLGYALLLDTFALLPVQMYAWGFSPALLLVLLALSLWPWLRQGGFVYRKNPAQWVVPVSLLLFALTRLPTGNVWDAVLDPWLWVLLQLAGLRGLWRAMLRR